MRTIPRDQRPAVVADCRRHMAENYRGDDPEAACLYWALTVRSRLARDGVRVIVQAGTAGWPRLTAAQDDGRPETLTHFTYEWSVPSPVQLAIMQKIGQLPEMHIWAAVPETGELIDLTTGYWPSMASKLTGMDWPGDAPPDYFWGTGQEIPPRAVYAADMHACLLAHRLGELAEEEQEFPHYGHGRQRRRVAR